MPRTILRCMLAGLVILCLCGPAMAKVALRVDIGWGGMYRVGRWTPIFVTASDDAIASARNVRIEVLTPHGRSFTLRLRQDAAIGRRPRTFVLYLPLPHDLYDSVVVLRDMASDRKLAEQQLDPNSNPGGITGSDWFGATRGNEFVIGVVGQRGAMELARGEYETDAAAAMESPQEDSNPRAVQDPDNANVKLGFLPMAYLPDAMVGYDTLDLLVLNAPDLAGMPVAVQQAIAAWVRSGGRLLMWLGDSPVPPESPLLELLPCTIGGVESVPIGSDEARSLGMKARLERLAARQLTSRPDARRLAAIKDTVFLYHGRAGLGTAAILSANPAQLVFDDEKAAKRFWRPILWPLLQPASTRSSENNARTSYEAYATQDDGLRAPAVEEIANRLGNAPGVGKFDFSYIAMIVLAMMLIVGPGDWFILKKLGKQPWTWATCCGWIALITIGGLYLGHAFRSGSLHYRTVRVLEQADERIVATMDVAGLYSPRTQMYHLDYPAGTWWVPMSFELPYQWQRQRRLATEVSLVQNRGGNYPMPMGVNIWNLRFMEGQSGEPRSISPAIRAALKRRRTPAGDEITGTLTNLSSATWTGLHVRTRNGVAYRAQPQQGGDAAHGPTATGLLAEPIKPGQTVSIRALIERREKIALALSTMEAVGYGPSGYYRNTGLSSFAFLRAACDLKVHRSRQVERLLADYPDLACIYAEGRIDQPAVKLAHPVTAAEVEEHWQVIRAMIQLEKERE